MHVRFKLARSVKAHFVFLLLTLIRCVDSGSILGFAVMAGVSHQLNVLKIGHELANRGHNFSILLSSTDAIGISTVTTNAFPGLGILTFEGPIGVGTEEWASGLSRDPQKVQYLPLLTGTYAYLSWGDVI